MPHILATVSGHGFGHLSISAPVLNRLHGVLPDLELTVASGLAEPLLRTRISAPFAYTHSALDFGVVTGPGLSVRADDTARAYRRIHADWTRRVSAYASDLERARYDLVLSNVSYLSLAAAAQVGIPALALCPLNWADMYTHYCSQTPGAESIHGQMLDAYGSARVFLRPAPSMPMVNLSNTQSIGPVAGTGTDVRGMLRSRLGLPTGTRLVLVAMGGHDLRLRVRWPVDESVCWLVTRSWAVDQLNVVAFEDLETSFLDLLASSDLLIGKPGYGGFTEAACAGVPVLYLPRPDWPEAEYLIRWLEQRHACKQVRPDRLHDGTFEMEVEALLERPRPAPLAPSGVAEAVDALLHLLDDNGKGS